MGGASSTAGFRTGRERLGLGEHPPQHVVCVRSEPDKARVWLDVRFGARLNRMFDLHPDGTRFAIAPVQNLQADHLTFVFNVFDELRRLAPIKP